MMRTTKILAAVLAAALGMSGAASAKIVSGVGTGAGDVFMPLTPVVDFTDVGNDNQQANDTLFGFDEAQDVTLTSDLTPDVGALIPAGTVVNSHYVFVDPAVALGGANEIMGSVTFDGEILGIIHQRSKLSATDADLGHPDVTYLNPSARGLEGKDSIPTIGPADTVNIHFFASSPGDYIRVLTAVPEPASMGLLALGGLALIRRR